MKRIEFSKDELQKIGAIIVSTRNLVGHKLRGSVKRKYEEGKQ